MPLILGKNPRNLVLYNDIAFPLKVEKPVLISFLFDKQVAEFVNIFTNEIDHAKLTFRRKTNDLKDKLILTWVYVNVITFAMVPRDFFLI